MTASARGPASLDDAVAFIARNPHVYLLSRRADGYPTGYAMMSRAHDGAVEFSTYRSSAKVRNLVREGVGAVLAVSKDDDGVCWAAGTVSVHDGFTWLEQPQGQEASTFRPDVPEEIGAKVASRHLSGKRCVVRLTLSAARFATKVV